MEQETKFEIVLTKLELMDGRIINIPTLRFFKTSSIKGGKVSKIREVLVELKDNIILYMGIEVKGVHKSVDKAEQEIQALIDKECRKTELRTTIEYKQDCRNCSEEDIIPKITCPFVCYRKELAELEGK